VSVHSVTIDLDGIPEHDRYHDVVPKLYAMHAAVHPRDRRDLIWVMHPDMRRLIEVGTIRNHVRAGTALQREDCVPPPPITEPPHIDTLFGCPLETWADMDPNTIEARAENATDRALRRAEERGQTFNVVKAVEFAPIEFPTPPPPTARALLRHWAKRFGSRRSP
jgi:hypothetical protein